MYTFKESDWRRYRKLLPQWQTRFMAGLCDEYAKLLTTGKDPCDTFWALEARIRKDKKNLGVIVEIRRSTFLFTLLNMLVLRVISEEDLDSFSEELRSELHRRLCDC